MNYIVHKHNTEYVPCGNKRLIGNVHGSISELNLEVFQSNIRISLMETFKFIVFILKRYCLISNIYDKEDFKKKGKKKNKPMIINSIYICEL